MTYPPKDDYLKLCSKGNLIPVYQEVWADLDTPVSTYFKIAKNADYSFLLESVEGEEKVARYSFLARDPRLVIEAKDGCVTVRHLHGPSKTDTFKDAGSPLPIIRSIMAQYSFVEVPGLPRFCGGLVGYIGYDTVRSFEHLPHQPNDDTGLPEALLILAQDLIIFDHINHKIKIVSCVFNQEGASKAQKLKNYILACQHIDRIISDLRKPLNVPVDPAPRTSSRKMAFRSNMDEATYKRMVSRAKKEIYKGEIIQAVLSQRFETKLKTDPIHVYRALRALNPSPYMYFLNFKNVQIVGSSPELLVRCEDGIVETRPIAGTRPRGKDEVQDTQLATDLLADPKERAEHVMLVDLGRNDLGRVCEEGSVQVPEFMTVERYSHVMHIVSSVRGKLKKEHDALDVLQAAFPAGTLSGAPKIRAIEIIDELEPTARGPYGGCIGYFSFSGNLDSCITIRTIVVVDGRAYIQAGAGIVADSNPKTEYQETVNKARAQMVAIEQAQSSSHHSKRKKHKTK
ncbi:MAG TPA: anthranilate synthase component I [Candidatus Omnitrophota bacterium]|nr:anthranilate synthase component I [Candidatus Omnitrophota bacterium]